MAKVKDPDTGMTFSEAFADARKDALKGGPKTFEWNGKQYGTKLKGEDEPKQGKVKEDPTIEAGKRQKSAPKEEKEDKRSRGTGAALAGTGVALGTAALLGGMRKSERDRKDREMSKGREDRSSRSPVRNISPEEAAFENEGGRYYKKGGAVKKMAGGGNTAPAPSPRPPAPKRSGPPIPEWLQNERRNQEQDTRNRKEREAYDKYDKNRLKDQGGLKKGGMASSRGDGIAQRGKTKGRMV
jgi:hypothetical protein